MELKPWLRAHWMDVALALILAGCLVWFFGGHEFVMMEAFP